MQIYQSYVNSYWHLKYLFETFVLSHVQTRQVREISELSYKQLHSFQ